MSDQPRNRNKDPWDHEAPGKRLEKKTKPVLTPAQAQKRKEKRIMILMIVLAVVMVLAAAVVMVYNRWVKKPSLPPGPGQSAPVESKDLQDSPDPEETLDFDAVQPKVGGARKSRDIYTFLIFGADVTSGLTDTIMVGTYDITNQEATVMSIPRDTLVNVRTSYKNINGVYNMNGKGEKGVAALKQEVSELVGFTPDYYVKIDWELVGEMVEAIGGVWYDIPHHMDYDDPYQDLHIHFDPGNQFLNGEDAMKVVRWRENNKWSPYYGEGGGSDINRLSNQQNFLKAVLKQTLQIKNVTRIGQLAELFGNRVESDLSVENIFWFAQEAIIGGLQVSDVEFCTMPYVGVFQGRYRYRVYPNQSELLKLINEGLNPFVEQVTIRQLDLIRVSADGDTLSSSTGRLADPSAAIPPVRETDPPKESGPLESGEPAESGAPNESGAPAGSAPVTTEPPPGGAVDTQPPDTQPPATAAVEPDPQPTPTPDAGPIDWGETPD